MNIFQIHNFGEVQGLELGYSIIGKPLMNTYLFYVDRTLIDTGQSLMRKNVMQYLKDYPVERILLTHHHEDHSGNAGPIRDSKKANVYGHPYAASKLREGFPIYPYQHLVWGSAAAVEVLPFPESIETGRYRLIPYHTPGHSKDHTVFLEKSQGWLFSGDLFLGTRIKYSRADENIADTIKSIKTVLNLDFEVLLCSHNPQTARGKDLMREKLQFLEDLFGEVEKLFRTGIPDKAIVKRYKKRDIFYITAMTCGNVSFSNMIRSAIRCLKMH